MRRLLLSLVAALALSCPGPQTKPQAPDFGHIRADTKGYTWIALPYHAGQ